MGALLVRPTDGARLLPEPVEIAGTAWSGAAPIQRVDVSTDGGLPARFDLVTLCGFAVDPFVHRLRRSSVAAPDRIEVAPRLQKKDPPSESEARGGRGGRLPLRCENRYKPGRDRRGLQAWA